MREQILKMLLDKNKDFISGEEISELLGISRTAVWKHINNLKNQGYNIESINKKGYRISEIPDDILTKENIAYNLKSKFIGNNIIHFDTIDSTNDYAKKIANDMEDGTVIISEEQTKGRGRMGRKWYSRKGDGIWLSIILKPDINPYECPFITLIAGASIIKSLDKLGVKSSIKWPNDIIVNNKKMCGVLTELAAEIDKVNYVVLGIGMNVKTLNFDDDIENIATSLYKEGYKLSRIDIVSEILMEFENLYTNYINNKDKKEVLDICKKYSAILNKNIYLLKNGEKTKAKCIDINEDGNLIVQFDDNSIKEIISGEVSIRGEEGYV
jgi:BirA family transcriptional regulator, biotin operon repressor / biotin---[acetyl-CoA-carboxylase] ligase